MSTQNIYDLDNSNNSSQDIVDVNPLSSQSTDSDVITHHFYDNASKSTKIIQNTDYEQTKQKNEYNDNEKTANEYNNIYSNSNQPIVQPQKLYSSPVNTPEDLEKNFNSSSFKTSINLPKIDFLKALIYLILPLLIFSSLFITNLLGLIVFWILSLIAVKLQPKLALIIALIAILFIIIKYPIVNYVTMIALGLLLFSSLFLGIKPSFSKFNKFITAAISILIGLWIAIPMSQIGSVRYLQDQYSNNPHFKTVADSLYIGAGSPKLSATSIEKNFKSQISTEISNSIKDKTNLIPAESQKVYELCKQLGTEQNLNETCNNLDKKQIDKNIDNMVSNQVDRQSEDLKKQFNDYPQVQMVQNLLNGLGNNNTSFLSTPYFIPSVVLLLIYVGLSTILQLISWPIILILKRVTLA